MKLEKPTPTQHNGPKPFLKLKDGESVTGVFRGEAFTWRCKWDGKTYLPDPEGSYRYKLNFIVNEDKKWVAKIFEFPESIYETIFEINQIKPVEEQWVKISRKGIGPKTNYILLPAGLIGKYEFEISKVELNILGEKKLQENVQEQWSPETPEHDYPMLNEKMPWD